MRKMVDLKNEIVLDGVDDVPGECKIFTGEHIDYVDALTGHILLNDLKGQLLNIIEGIGLPERQETAIKRQVTNALHDNHHHIGESLELVKNPLSAFYEGPGRIVTGHPDVDKLINK